MSSTIEEMMRRFERLSAEWQDDVNALEEILDDPQPVPFLLPLQPDQVGGAALVRERSAWKSRVVYMKRRGKPNKPGFKIKDVNPTTMPSVPEDSVLCAA
jgi:hypothetical protein